ncbi:hypothetical protein [Chitinophaga sp. CB10]|uniref:hypothetical protein n=1 Tax=Chitinophaga sp. CB10 TaxID=1891659 RepID=UPI0025BACAEC|nr:hypothetical protein [Chitinophaga sp. CB10]
MSRSEIGMLWNAKLLKKETIIPAPAPLEPAYYVKLLLLAAGRELAAAGFMRIVKINTIINIMIVSFLEGM